MRFVVLHPNTPPLVSTMVKLQCILLCTVSVAAQPEPLLSSTLTLSTRAILIGISQENWEPPTHTLLIRVHTLIRFIRFRLTGQRFVSYVLIRVHTFIIFKLESQDLQPLIDKLCKFASEGIASTMSKVEMSKDIHLNYFWHLMWKTFAIWIRQIQSKPIYKLVHEAILIEFA